MLFRSTRDTLIIESTPLNIFGVIVPASLCVVTVAVTRNRGASGPGSGWAGPYGWHASDSDHWHCRDNDPAKWSN